MNAETTEYETEPKQALRRCILQTRWDLRRSVRRNRVIPLPTLLRRFKRQWVEYGVGMQHNEYKQMGLDVIRHHYQTHQPFKLNSASVKGDTVHGGS